MKTFFKKEHFGTTKIDDDIYMELILKKRVLTTDNTGYSYVFVDGKKHRLHKWIMKYDGKLFIDHIDSDKLNNLRSNLRISTPSQNNQNKNAQKNSKSKYVGVGYGEDRFKWRAYLNGKHLGYFSTEEEAVIVRNKKAQELNDQGSCYKIEIYDGPTIKNITLTTLTTLTTLNTNNQHTITTPVNMTKLTSTPPKKLRLVIIDK